MLIEKSQDYENLVHFKFMFSILECDLSFINTHNIIYLLLYDTGSQKIHFQRFYF